MSPKKHSVTHILRYFKSFPSFYFLSNTPRINDKVLSFGAKTVVHVSFYKQPSCQGSNVKNGLKVKQLPKQPPTLKTLLQKNLVEIWVKIFSFSILSLLKLNLSTTVFGTN